MILKQGILLFLILNFFSCGNAQPTSNNDLQMDPDGFAVIELFTSQGCSSCPPADKLLSEVIRQNKGKKVYALSYHVDYWNRLGWNDRFSDPQYSQIQRAYAGEFSLNSVYTPQMVVNGAIEFVGSDKNKLYDVIKESLKIKPEVIFEKCELVDTSKNYQINYQLIGDISDCEIIVAMVSGLETTAVKRGENEGRTLVNENVVKALFSDKASLSGTVRFSAPEGLKTGNISFIVWIRNISTMKIKGATAVLIK